MVFLFVFCRSGVGYDRFKFPFIGQIDARFLLTHRTQNVRNADTGRLQQSDTGADRVSQQATALPQEGQAVGTVHNRLRNTTFLAL
jgi:hypothetical protein